jgi:ABC-type multidrug transport system ATPase subunit
LLGHNGAGKSTTVNMICGLIEKDSGKIIINSLDIEKQLDEIR